MHTNFSPPLTAEQGSSLPVPGTIDPVSSPLEQLTSALHTHSRHTTLSQLGNRSAYIGMSDVGRAFECMRVAVASKLCITAPSGMPALNRLLTLQRGHWQEHGIVQALHSAGHTCIPQLEIAATFHGVPIKAHLDLTFIHSAPRPWIQIWELKSNHRLPVTLYTANEVQLYGQLGLLHACWNRPCFNAKDESGQYLFRRMTFPEAVRHVFQIDVPTTPDQVVIEGHVVAISMADAKVFGPYTPDHNMLGVCLHTATTLWGAMQGVASGTLPLNEVPTCQGFHPLCDWCDASGDCPKFKPIYRDGEPIALDDEYADYVDQLVQLKARKRALEEEITAMEDTLRGTWHRIVTPFPSLPAGWIAAGNYRFRSTLMPGRSTLDHATLKEELQRITRDEQEVERILARSRKTGAPYERLIISPINTTGV